MKLKKIFTIMLSAAAVGGLYSCNDFLDELPDNRAELNTVEKINKLLVSAYPTRSYVRMCELASDNCDDRGEKNPNGNMLMNQNNYWKDMTEADNDSNVNTWQAYYNSIGVANTALQAIADLGTPAELLPAKGEALLCRAYAHFCLTMLYCLPYHPTLSGEYLGVT
ncbi:MAG: RagB/SusD family nutrient uptake outer membrane protein [Alistipes sp.]|nr:RagB/SusD family nutrient uptake outer membrane protein [Alistipes sp.]